MHEHPSTTESNGLAPPLNSGQSAPPTAILSEEQDEMLALASALQYEEDRMNDRLRRFGFGALSLVAVIALAFFVLSIGHFAPEGAAEFPERFRDVAEEPPVPLAQPVTAWHGQEGEGRLYVITYPPGAIVRLDEDSLGVTPMPPYLLSVGTYALSIQKAGYVPYDATVFVPNGETSFHHAELQAVVARSMRSEGDPEAGARPTHGGLAVRSEPAGGEVWLNDEWVGTTPLVLDDLDAGWHRVAIRHADYAPYVEEVEVELGVEAEVHTTLFKPEGTLTVLVRPWGSIYIDDRLHKPDTDAPYEVALAAGSYRIRALHPMLGALQRIVTVEAGESERVVFEFDELENDQPLASAAPVPQRPEQRPVLQLSEVLAVAEEPPVLIGGLEGLHRMARYPEKAHTFGVEGRVFLQFIVGEDGRVREPQVVRGLGMGCDEEALRVIREARFTPGRVGGQPVAVRHALSIRFKANSNP